MPDLDSADGMVMNLSLQTGDNMYLVTKAQIKQVVGDINISEDFYPALNMEVERILKRALERAKQNNRRTLMARDI